MRTGENYISVLADTELSANLVWMSREEDLDAREVRQQHLAQLIDTCVNLPHTVSLYVQSNHETETLPNTTALLNLKYCATLSNRRDRVSTRDVSAQSTLFNCCLKLYQ